MRIRTGLFGTLAAGAAAVALIASPHASAGNVVVVHGTDFPDPDQTRLSPVGCHDMYGVTPETPQPMIGEGPGDTPLGVRSLAYDLTGGNAIGPVFRVGSVASTTTASVAVHPWVTAATGVGYVGYQAPDDDGTGLIWLGRTSLSAPGGSWTTVDIAQRSFLWTQYYADTMQVAAAGPDQALSVAEFAAQHGGDGPGVFSVGFGCDGVPFNMDDLQVSSTDGSTTYDLEGLTTDILLGHRAARDGSVTLRGVLRTGDGDPLPGSTLRLEQADAAAGPWRTVGVHSVVDGEATAVVAAGTVETWYRWEFVDRPLAAGSTSSVYAVPGTTTDQSTATPTPSGTAAGTPTARPTLTAQPTATAHPTPSETPSTAGSASPTPSQTPDATPTGTPTRETSQPTSSPTSSPTIGSSASPPAGPTTRTADQGSSATASVEAMP